jgi:class 3 adenylate cyclase
MIRSFNQKRTAALTAIAAVVAVAVLVAPRLLPFLEVIENWVGDLRVALLAPPAPRNPDIVILSITEETLAQLPYRSPVDRGFLAGVLDALAAKKVRAVGVDILFDQPTEPDKDAALARAIAAFPAPLVVAWADAEGGLTESQIAFMNRFLPDAVKGRANILRDRRDGTVRWIYPGQLIDGAFQRSFTAEIAARLGTAVPDTAVPFAFAGPPGEGGSSFAGYPVHAAAHLPKPWLQGKIVLIGADVPGTDRFRTPFAAAPGDRDGTMPGVMLHAHALAQLMEGRRLPEVGLAVEIGLTVVLVGLGMLFVLMDAPLPVKTGALLASTFAFWVGGFALYARGGPLITLFVPTLGLWAATGLGSAYAEREERQQKRFIREAFSRFISPGVVAKLMADPSRLNLLGERRDLTFIFTDIAGFTTLSEGLEASDLVGLVNEYLDGMSEIVLQHDGTIDKFIGDAVVAFFGAPGKQDNHAERAVEAALHLDRFAQGFAEEKRAQGIPFGITRIGVHTGEAMVGNFGGRQRFDYTAMGDTVNTAARLESVNKQLGTRICVSAVTAAMSPHVTFRPVGTLVLKGKTEGIAVLEPLDETRAVGETTEAYLTAFALLDSDHAAARTAFAHLAECDPDDGLAAFHLKRLEGGETGIVAVLDEK